MTKKISAAEYAKELRKQFGTMRAWAIDQWPISTHPLVTSDFNLIEKELDALLDAKIFASNDYNQDNNQEHDQNKQAQYVPVSPMPWP